MRYKLNKILIGLICVWLSFNNINAFGQSGKVEGKVTDSIGKALPFANVILYKGQDSSIAAYTTTNDVGFFHFDYKDFFPNSVTATSIGYQKQNIKFEASGKLNFSIFINFKLSTKPLVLNEVNIIEKSKISQKGDTTTYKLSAFTNSTERALEEALAKLPGFKVSESGTISVNGTPIQKILIDGDDLLDKNYKLLSKNLSADLVDKVQVLDKFVNNPLMAGLEKTNDKALNITLKDERKKLFFGDLAIDGGLVNRYAVLGNGIVLAKKAKAYILLNANNTGIEAVPAAPPEPVPKATSLGTYFDPDLDNNSLINISTGQIPLVDFKRTYNNKSLLQSVSFVSKPLNRLLIKGNFNFYLDKNYQERNTLTGFKLISDSLQISEGGSYQKKALFGESNVNLGYDFAKNAKLIYNVKSSIGSSPESANILTNGKYVSQDLKGTFTNIDQRLNYTWRINTNRALIADAAFINKEAPQDLKISGYNYSTILNKPDTTPVHQHYYNPIQYLGTQIMYYIEKGTSTVAYTLGVNRYSQKLESEINTSKISQSSLSDFINNIIYAKNDFFAQASFLNKFSRSWELTAKLGAHELTQKLINNLQKNAEQQFNHDFNLRPEVNFTHKFSQKSKITFSYNSRTFYPDVTNVYDNYLLNNYRQLTHYSTSTNLLKEYKGSINYSYSNIYNQFIAFLSTYYSINKNNYADSLLINSNFILTTRVPTNQDYRLFGILSGLDKFIPALSSTIRFQSYVINYHTINIINGEPARQISSWSTDSKLSLTTAFNSWFNFNTSLQYKTVNNQVRSGNLKTSTNNYTVKGYLQTDFKLNKSLFFQLYGTSYYWKNTSQGTNPIYFFDNSFLWQVIKNKLSLSVTIKNILNYKTLTFTNVTDYQSILSSYAVLPRMALVGLKYQF